MSLCALRKCLEPAPFSASFTCTPSWWRRASCASRALFARASTGRRALPLTCGTRIVVVVGG
eukprot:scaffold104298_cov60-Phaeocystis_antarctica.AAC.1